MQSIFKPALGFAASCLLICLCIPSPAYSITLPIEGAVRNSTETFLGKAVVHLSGVGSVRLETNKNVTCTGGFVHTDHRKGNGTIRCDDGRRGVFDFVTRGLSGSGAGKIGDEDFEFRIGK